MELPAGSEVDKAVAEFVFGLDVFDNGKTLFGKPVLTTSEGRSLKRYSTNISAAWEVVEKIGGTFSLSRAWKTDDPDWVGYSCYMVGGHTALAETAPLAVCRAALKVVMMREKE